MRVEDCARVGVPGTTWRLIPSRFPPIPAFDTVSTVADMTAVMDLEGWTNDRLVAGRLKRLPSSEWCVGVANASVIMAAFLHAPSSGARFNGPDLGAWYAATDVDTAIAEVGHHLRREAFATGIAVMTRTYRAYVAELRGDGYVDLRGQAMTVPHIYDPASHAASQQFGEAARQAGADGVVFDSLRLLGGMNIAAYRPRLVSNVAQERHFRLTVPQVGSIQATTLTA